MTNKIYFEIIVNIRFMGSAGACSAFMGSIGPCNAQNEGVICSN